MRRHDERRHQIPKASTGNIAIRPEYGLHTRLARRLTETSRRFRASITFFDRGGQRADARSLFELLLLGVMCGEAVTVECVGEDADAAFTAVASLLGAEDAGE